MHLLEKPIDYSKTEEFAKDVNKLTLDDAKKLVKKLYEDNRNFKQLAARAAITIEQYKHLLAVFDGYDKDKENMSEIGNHFRKMLTCTLDASESLAFWMMMLCEAAKRIVFEDPVINELFTVIGTVCHSICKTTCKFKPRKVLLPDEPNEICVRNLEGTEENSENSEGGFYSRQSSLINRGDKSTNLVQKNSKKRRGKRGKSTLSNAKVLQVDDTRCDEQSGDSPLKQSASTCENDISEASTCENDINEGGENEVTGEKSEERREKTFGISYLKSQNLFKKDVIQNKKIYANVSVECSESEHSTAFDELAKSGNCMNEGNQSVSAHESDSFSSFVSSKSPRRYKRKHSLNTYESNVMGNEKNKRKISTSQNSDPVTKRSRRYRRNYTSDTPENYDCVKSTDETETITLQNSISSSEKHETSVLHESELRENGPKRKGKKIKNLDSVLASETEVKDVISSVKPRRNRRGRRKKLNMTQEQETKKNFESSDKDERVFFENVPSSSKSVIKRAYIRLTDVIDDPEAQHYLDVIQCKEKKEKESASLAKWKEKNEVEETTINKERNEMDASQEWNVLDAVSDEEDKEFDNMEGVEELSNNYNQQTSDSDVEQLQAVNDNYDGEQLEIDYSDKELDCSSNVELESFPSKHDDNKNCNSSDSEMKECKKGPTTPDVSPHESDFEDNSDAQDENDADADSVRSNEDADISSRSPTSGSLIYGSKELDASSPQSDESEVIAVMDDEENGSEYSSD